MRIWGSLVPPGHLRWAVASTGVVALGVLIAAVVDVAGVFGSAETDTGTTVRATVVTGVPCDRPGTSEVVAFRQGRAERRVRFDGCGHAEGEPVEITVPTGAVGGDLVVHAAQAAVGDSVDGEGLGLLLIVVSGMAGAGYTCLLRRAPA